MGKVAARCQVSVLMSVYNGDRWVEEAVNSIRNQTFDDFEFIVVNDGSTDRSLNILTRLASEDARIAVYDKPNTGLADSLNFGLERARGRWIARIDADDLCDPTRLESQYNFARRNPKVVLIGTGLQLIDEFGTAGKEYRYPSAHSRLVGHLLSGRSIFAHSTAFFQKDVARGLGGYRRRFRRSQDTDLWLRLSEAGEIACVSGSLVKVRKHPTQISNDDSGFQQRTDSHVAKVSYWLRQSGYPDPVGVDSTDDQYDAFREWIIDGLKARGDLERQSRLRELRRLARSDSSRFSCIAMLLPRIVSEPCLLYDYAMARTGLVRVGRKDALEWMARAGNGRAQNV